MPKKFKKPHPKWDLYKDGLSYTILSKFINCRERMRLYAVEGLRSVDRREAMEFGTIFHKVLEFAAQKKSTMQINKALLQWSKKTNVDYTLCRIAAVLLPHYQKEWQHERYNYIASEEIFDVPYRAYNGKIIRLRGRRDEMYQTEKGLWIQENKTKTNIDETKIMNCLPEDLQTMMYVYSASIDYAPKTIAGVLYNVIRKPALRQGVNESVENYLLRIHEDCTERPEHYFHRYEVDLCQSDIDNFVNEILDPHISAIVEWWESIKHNPFDPWFLKGGQRNPRHWRRPFGVFDPMTFGKGDYFEYITSKGRSRIGLEVVETAFPELEGEQGSQLKK